MLAHDVIVVGGGAAGLRAAIEASKHCDTAVLSLTHPIHSNTVLAHEGMNAALNNNRQPCLDSPDKHLHDTIACGEGLAHIMSAEALCHEAPKRAVELEHWGLPFSRDEKGLIAQRPYAGRGFPRTCFAGDGIGHRLMHTLFQQALRWGIKLYSDCRLLHIVARDGECHGLVALNLRTGELLSFKARAVILATGGLGRMYRMTTNSYHTTGSGISVAYAAGARLRDPEFVEFHSLTLFPSGVLVPEAVLNMGGKLLNGRQERFMQNYAPEELERAEPRVLLRAVQAEINEAEASNGPCVTLSLRHLGARKIIGNLESVRQTTLSSIGLDPVNADIPVSPAQHYTVGGIVTDPNGATNISRLYAAGECACTGAHGAALLPGNSLLEAVVFGCRAGNAAVAHTTEISSPDVIKAAAQLEQERIEQLISQDEGELPHEIGKFIAAVMTDKVGVLRSEAPLREAVDALRDMEAAVRKIAVRQSNMKFNFPLLEAITVQETLPLARAVAVSALAREESRGAHFRLDYGRRDDDNWQKHTLVTYDDDGPHVQYTAVHHRRTGGKG